MYVLQYKYLLLSYVKYMLIHIQKQCPPEVLAPIIKLANNNIAVEGVWLSASLGMEGGVDRMCGKGRACTCG